MVRSTMSLVSFAVGHLALAALAKAVARTPGTGISLWAPNGLVLAVLLLVTPRNWWKWLCVAVVSELISNSLWFYNPWLVAATIGAILIRCYLR